MDGPKEEKDGGDVTRLKMYGSSIEITYYDKYYSIYYKLYIILTVQDTWHLLLT